MGSVTKGVPTSQARQKVLSYGMPKCDLTAEEQEIKKLADGFVPFSSALC